MVSFFMSSLKFHYSYAVLTTQVRLTCLFQPTGEMLLVSLSEFSMRILRDDFGQNLEKCFPALLKRSRLLSDLELTHEDTRMKTAMRSISICFPSLSNESTLPWGNPSTSYSLLQYISWLSFSISAFSLAYKCK